MWLRKKFGNNRPFSHNSTSSFDIASKPISAESFRSVWHFFLDATAGQKVKLIIYQIICSVRSMDIVIWSIPFGIFVKTLENLEDRTLIWQVAKKPFLYMALAWLLIDALYRITGLMRSYWIRPNLEYFVTKRMTSLVMERSYQFFLQQPSSVNNRINQLAEGAYDSIVTISESFIPGIFGSFGVLVLLYNLNTLVGGIVTLHIIVYLSILFLTFPKCIRASGLNALSHNIVIRKTLNVIYNMEIVKAFAGEVNEISYLGIFQKRRRLMNRIAMSYPEKTRMLVSLSGFIFLGLTLTIVEIDLFAKGIFCIADISVVLSALSGLMQLLYVSTNDVLKVVEDIGRCKEGIGFFRNSSLQVEKRTLGEKKLLLKDNKIIFNGVSFWYSTSVHPILSKKDIVINSGEKVALIGLSGAGKSTFVNLIMGFFLPNKGKVLVGGYDTKKIDLRSLRSHITFIPQQCGLFNRSILDNIRYGKEDATYEEVVEAAKKAEAHDFITSFDGGYYHDISDGGSNLSGGQRQRIAIARAILNDAPIVILDEPTSAIDNHTKNLIQTSLDRLMENRTSIVIAHKLDTIRHMDRALVFKDGDIIEDGSHDELISKKDSYYSYLWRLQYGGSSYISD